MITAAITRTRTAVTMILRVRGFTVVMLRGRYDARMHQFRVFAVSINDVRDIFGADALLAARFRTVAAKRFAPVPHHRTMIEKIGPLFARDRAREVDTRFPLAGDVDALLAGGHIPADRLPQCWLLMDAWLEEISANTLGFTLENLDATEFELARAGLPSTFSLRSLATRELGIPLHGLPGQHVGYSKHEHAAETAHHLRLAHADAAVDPSAAMDAVASLVTLLEGINRDTDDALDLVVLSQRG